MTFYFLCFLFETVSSKKDQDEEDADNSDAEDLAEADEDESDLDLAWKMLDVARAIVEKDSGDTMEKVDILSALAEVALERGTFAFYLLSCDINSMVCVFLIFFPSNSISLSLSLSPTSKRFIPQF